LAIEWSRHDVDWSCGSSLVCLSFASQKERRKETTKQPHCDIYGKRWNLELFSLSASSLLFGQALHWLCTGQSPASQRLMGQSLGRPQMMIDLHSLAAFPLGFLCFLLAIFSHSL